MSAKLFKLFGFICILLLFAIPVIADDDNKPKPVEVVNFPDPQNVTVDNFPNTQNVSGTVDVGNFPEDEDGNIKVNVQKDESSPCDLYKFIGVTEAKAIGNVGWKTLNEMCISEYGESTRMCTSEEIMKTPVAKWPSLGNTAWIHPVFVVGGSSYVDYSGRNHQDAEDLCCNSWCQGGGTGLALHTSGKILLRECLHEYAVTCCTPDE